MSATDLDEETLSLRVVQRRAEFCEFRAQEWLQAILDDTCERPLTVPRVQWLLAGDATVRPRRVGGMRKPKVKPYHKDDLRTMVDSWFAYANHATPGFLNDGLNVQMLNTGNLAKLELADLGNSKIRAAVSSLHFISHQAQSILDRIIGETELWRDHQMNCIGAAAHKFNPRRPLVKDHVVPVDRLKLELQRRRMEIEAEGRHMTTVDVEALLKERYRLGLITQCENNRFRKPKLQSDLPEGANHWRARYDHCDVRILGTSFDELVS
jgi:hypothetical protein